MAAPMIWAPASTGSINSLFRASRETQRVRWPRYSMNWQANQPVRLRASRTTVALPPAGKPWSAMTVIRARDRLAAAANAGLARVGVAEI
jgi:hypothetical protein